MTETVRPLRHDRRIEAGARLRPEYQLTLPEPIATALGAHPDDLLVFETDLDQPGTARVRLISHRFAGALTGVYGTTDEFKAFLREEHQAWRE
jgi:bifunctional DNA-binding transcriptional regulator/antitoxin component of YhaV-PrlF toxin-antitoxin module